SGKACLARTRATAPTGGPGAPAPSATYAGPGKGRLSELRAAFFNSPWKAWLRVEEGSIPEAAGEC
ncbi:MAG TPA: hypothetical protein VJA25_01695, partial [Dehalococcoidia bacterium]|nr:hypothetical protein [Dehalococcoidia bacterium]